MGRAQKSGLLEVRTANPREFATDVHRTVDDSPYGGGPGMVMKVDLIDQALQTIHEEGSPVIVLDAAAPLFTNRDARKLSELPSFTLVCGHYEGMDERVRTELGTHAFSIGSFVLTGGELPALCLCDAVVRLVPGVLGRAASHQEDSFEDGMLSYPVYTRPAEYRGAGVPDVLKSGDHGAIERWRREQQILRTRTYRPDLLVSDSEGPPSRS